MVAGLVAGIIGLFVAGIVWHLARRQAARIKLVGGDLQTSVPDWLPLWGFGTSQTDVVTGVQRSQWQAIFEVCTAVYFAALGWKFGFSTELFMAIAFSVPLLVIGLVDYWTRLDPHQHHHARYSARLGLRRNRRNQRTDRFGPRHAGWSRNLHLLLRACAGDLPQSQGRSVRTR